MENETILKKLDDHEERINKNTNDITDVKISNSVQGESIRNLNSSIKNLTDTVNKCTDKIEGFMINSGNKNTDNWKFIISVILIPVIFYLLSRLK